MMALFGGRILSAKSAATSALRIWKEGMSVTSSSAQTPRLICFTLQSPKQAELEFGDGSRFYLSAEFLRVQSPAADSKIRTIQGEKVITGRRHVGIMSVEQVGNYGLRITFDDLHNTGIYTWDYLYNLGINKFTLMRDYIKILRKHNLSRDPQRRK